MTSENQPANPVAVSSEPPADLHPLAAMLANHTYEGPEKIVAIDKAKFEAVEQGLIELAGKGPDFFRAFRQITSFGVGLGETRPDSPAGITVLAMLDRVAEIVMPKLGEEEMDASHDLVEGVGQRFKSFVEKAEGEKLPDNGERLVVARDIRG